VTGSGYQRLVLSAHPVAFWALAAEGASEPDLTGSWHPGRYMGGTPGLAKLPDGERVADFNGESEYLRVPSSAMFSITHTGELTWEAWIRPDTLTFTSVSDPRGSGYVDWMGKCHNYSRSCEWEARMYSAVNPQGRCSRLSAYAFNPTAGLGSGADWQPRCGMLRAGAWLYVVGEYQTRSTPLGCRADYPGTISIWVNAVKQDFAAHKPTGCMSQYHVAPRPRSSPLDIGTMALDSFFQGAIGKVAIYDTLLSQAQISAHYQAMTGQAPSGSCAEICTLP
jgi:hypothetical protein